MIHAIVGSDVEALTAIYAPSVTDAVDSFRVVSADAVRSWAAAAYDTFTSSSMGVSSGAAAAFSVPISSPTM